MTLLDVNWRAVVLAALGGFLTGGIRYGTGMGKRWVSAVGRTEDNLKVSIRRNLWLHLPARIPGELHSGTFLGELCHRSQ